MKKTPGDVIILHKCTKNHNHMLSWDTMQDRCNCYFSFWAFFLPFFFLPPFPLTAQKLKMKKKKEKNAWRYHHFIQLWSDDVQFLRHGGQQTDGQRDERKKWHTELGVPPKNLVHLTLLNHEAKRYSYVHM